MIKPILYVEDDENDAFLMNRAFEKLKLAHPLRILPDGKLAIAYLSGNPPYVSRDENPLPCLMFLDLSMPGRTGFDVLQWLQNQPALSTFPVIVLTSSNQQSDVQNAKLLGAKGYLVKPGEPSELLRMVKSTVEHWLDTSY
ncbi:MAG: response regulator [Verrucomicrobia bacterium]|nr:response regulator [Verrucomicrobiota bacterium]